jgi:hypothetical protein
MRPVTLENVALQAVVEEKIDHVERGQYLPLRRDVQELLRQHRFVQAGVVGRALPPLRRNPERPVFGTAHRVMSSFGEAPQHSAAGVEPGGAHVLDIDQKIAVRKQMGPVKVAVVLEEVISDPPLVHGRAPCVEKLHPAFQPLRRIPHGRDQRQAGLHGIRLHHPRPVPIVHSGHQIGKGVVRHQRLGLRPGRLECGSRKPSLLAGRHPVKHPEDGYRCHKPRGSNPCTAHRCVVV